MGWIGALLLLGGGLWLGLALGRGLGERVEGLESWIFALALLESELTYSCPDLPRLLEGVARRTSHPARTALAQAGAGLDALGETPFPLVWHSALEGGILNGEDRAPLERVGEILGRYSASEQAGLLRGVREELKTRLAAAQGERERKRGAYAVAGTALGGLLAAVLL